MPRKSLLQRKSELTALQEEYNQNPANQQFYNWDYSFVGAMLERIERNKTLTKKMRDKIDDLVATGMKQVPENNDADELIEMAEYLDPKMKSILLSFADKIRKNYNLSQKQKDFMQALLNQAEEIKVNGYWQPTDEIKNTMGIVLSLAERCYTQNYWYSHPSAERAIAKLQGYLAGTIKNYSEADWDRAKYAVRGKFKQYNAPRFSIGDKCLIHEIDYNQKSGERTQIKHYGIVCSEVYVGNHELCYDVLWKGTCESISDSRMKKR